MAMKASSQACCHIDGEEPKNKIISCNSGDGRLLTVNYPKAKIIDMYGFNLRTSEKPSANIYI